MYGDTRQKIFLWNDSQSASSMVNWERSVNNAPPILKDIFSNKPLYYLRIIRENYLQAYSPQFLFLYGETGGLAGIYGTYFRGVLYFVELPFLLLGFFYLLRYKEKKVSIFLLLWFLIAPLPTAFTLDQSYVMRCIMLLPVLAIIIGSGIFFACSYIQNKKAFIKVPLLIIGILVYSFFISEYLYQYYYRYSIYGAENWFKSSKDVSEYVLHHKSQYQRVEIVDSGPLLIQYAFYSKMDQQRAANEYKKSDPKQIDSNVWLVDGCIDTKGAMFDPKTFLPPHTLYIVPDICFNNLSKPLYRITQSGQSLRTIWKIYARN